jgi:hypothetical protein
MANFLETIFEPLKEVFLQFRAFLPGLLAMVVILVMGILLARIFKAITVRCLVTVKFDRWSDRMGFTALMRKGDVWGSPSGIIGSAAFWLLTLITLMVALSALRIAALDLLVERFFGYIPRVFSAVMILAIGYILAGFFGRAVLIASANRGFHYAKLLAEAVRSLLMVLILAMAMEQLQIAPVIVLAAFSIIFGGIVVALAIAFGVGGIDAARRVIERETKGQPEEKNKNDIEHI